MIAARITFTDNVCQKWKVEGDVAVQDSDTGLGVAASRHLGSTATLVKIRVSDIYDDS